MKVLVLNYEFPPVGGGGGAVSAMISKGLIAAGHDVRVQTGHFKGLNKRETRDGYELFRNGSSRKKLDTCTVWEMFRILCANIWPVLRHCRTWKPDVIHVHFAVPTGALAWLANVFYGVPYLMTTHLGDVPGAVPEQTDRLFKWIKFLTWPIWKRAAKVTAVSNFVRDLGEKAYGYPVQTIFNPADLADVEVSGHSNDLRILFAGRFNPQKNLPFLVKILSGLKNKPWSCILAGDGPQMEEVRQLVRDHGLEDRFSFPGWVSPTEVNKLMSRSDVLLMPSLSEGLPVVGVQALAHGLAVVGSRIGGLLDVVEDGKNGWLVESDDLDGFRDVLIQLMNDKELRAAFKSASLEKSKQFEIGEITRQYALLMEEIRR